MRNQEYFHDRTSFLRVVLEYLYIYISNKFFFEVYLKVVVRSEKSVHLDHTAIVYAGVPYLHLKNILNIANQHNFELAMRLKTSLNNGNLFFTDLNGYQVYFIQFSLHNGREAIFFCR